jgi:hypothetical protein
MYSFVLIFITSLLLIADSIGNTTTIFMRTGLHSYDFIVPTLIALLGIRLWKNSTIPLLVRTILNWFVIPCVGISAAVLTILDFYLPINTVFAYTGLRHSHILLLTLFLIIASLIQQPTTWWRTHWKKVLTILPFASFVYMILVRLLEYDIFSEIVKEDRPIEYIQFFILAFAGMYFVDFGLRLNWTYWNIFTFKFNQIINSNIAKLFFILCGLVMLLVAGDEISWGQRIVGIQTPESFARVNRQGEITFHNMYAVEWLVINTYVFISLFGLLTWPVGKTILHFIKQIQQPTWYEWLKPFLVLVPQPHLFGFFLLSSYFFVQQLRHYGGIFHVWSEPAELALKAGTIAWLVEVSRQVYNLRKNG